MPSEKKKCKPPSDTIWDEVDQAYCVPSPSDDQKLVRKDIDLGLSEEEKRRLYTNILRQLNGLRQKGYTTDGIYDIIREKYDCVSIKTTKSIEAYEIKIVILFALYKVKNILDLKRQLSLIFSSKDFNEIKNLIEKVSKEIRHFTGEYFFKNLGFFDDMPDIKSTLTVTYERKISVWKEIYNYLTKNKNSIKKYQLGHNENELFDYLREIIYNHLNNNTELLDNLSINEKSVVPREIIYIYLITGEEPPHKLEILRKVGKKKNTDELHRLGKISELFNIELPIANSEGIELGKKIRLLLDSKEEDIIKGNFIPDTRNLVSINEEYKQIRDISRIVSMWLTEHTKFKSLRDYKGNFVPSYKLRKLLNSRKQDILEGKFYPTIINLRKIDKDYDKITDPHTIINNWLVKTSNNKFQYMRQLIEFFIPHPSLLGYSEKKLKHEEYTLKFESLKYRIKKAFFQTIKIIDNEDLIQIEPKDIRGWRTLFKHLNLYKDFNFTDLLTGEIITPLDYSNVRINFHHIDGLKLNDNDDNLCFLLKGNHAMITGAERYNTELKDFFIKILKANLNSIKEGKIPLSWKTDWRELAKKSGIYIPKGYYNRRSSKKTILNKQSQDNSLDSFLDF